MFKIVGMDVTIRLLTDDERMIALRAGIPLEDGPIRFAEAAELVGLVNEPMQDGVRRFETLLIEQWREKIGRKDLLDS